MGDVTNIFFLYKISEKKYIESLATGKVYFSCCGRFVNIVMWFMTLGVMYTSSIGTPSISFRIAKMI